MCPSILSVISSFCVFFFFLLPEKQNLYAEIWIYQGWVHCFRDCTFKLVVNWPFKCNGHVPPTLTSSSFPPSQDFLDKDDSQTPDTCRKPVDRTYMSFMWNLFCSLFYIHWFRGRTELSRLIQVFHRHSPVVSVSGHGNYKFQLSHAGLLMMLEGTSLTSESRSVQGLSDFRRLKNKTKKNQKEKGSVKVENRGNLDLCYWRRLEVSRRLGCFTIQLKNSPYNTVCSASSESGTPDSCSGFLGFSLMVGSEVQSKELREQNELSGLFSEAAQIHVHKRIYFDWKNLGNISLTVCSCETQHSPWLEVAVSLTKL